MYDLIERFTQRMTADFGKHIAEMKAEMEARMALLNGAATAMAVVDTGFEPAPDPLGGDDKPGTDVDEN